jgi:hypothetical protein
MSGFVCSCASPACQAGGCMRLRETMPNFAMPLVPTPGIGQPSIPTLVPPVVQAKPLTEADVRRIFREELVRAGLAVLDDLVDKARGKQG